MEAVLLRKYSSPDSLEIRDIEKPRPAEDQVLIKINAASVNDSDWALLHGTPFVPNRFMAELFRSRIIVGSDIAGVVEAVGSAVGTHKHGDQVYGDLSGCGFEGFAGYVCAQ